MTRISAPWLSRSETQAVFVALQSGDVEAWFVGGCVRNALLGLPSGDIDLATAALPEKVAQLAESAGMKFVPTGIEHGTVTVVSGGVAHEITTFRQDVDTDGRRAVVRFGTDMRQDASRRDFTMNALYADRNGTVIDPLGGLPDLKARRVRFIGVAVERIKEDYLRSLRFFRFHAWYGDPRAGMDPDALDAIASTLGGMEKLSRERVGSEFAKLCSAADPAPAVAAMRATGLLGVLVPGADDQFLAPLAHLEAEIGLEPFLPLRLAVLGDVETFQTLRLSRKTFTDVAALREAAFGTQGPAELGYRLKRPMAKRALALRAALTSQPVDFKALELADLGASAEFPVRAADLMPARSGAALGDALTRLEQVWIGSEFTLSREALLSREL